MSTFSPVEALRAIGAVCADVDMSPAQRLAIIRVLLYADNDTGLAWAAYRTIRKETGLAPATIRAALRYAEGRYLDRAGVGRNGAVQYRALQPVKRASKGETPALHPLAQSASASEAKLAPATNPKTNSKRSAADKPPPDPRVTAFIDWFTSEYHKANGRTYVVAGGKDGATVKRLLASLDRDAICGLAELKRAVKNMLADAWGKDKASIGLLASQLNTWRGNGHKTGSRSTFTPAAIDDEKKALYDSLARRF